MSAVSNASSSFPVKGDKNHQRYKKVHVSLKDVHSASGTDTKALFLLNSVCAQAKPVSDVYVPPRTPFQGIKFLETIRFRGKSLTDIYALSSLPKWNAPGDSPAGTFSVSMKAWTHIDERHVIEYDLTDHSSYLTARRSPSFKKGRGTSVYVHPSVVFPLMLASLFFPDQVIHDPNRNNYCFLKLFSSEIGHGPMGECCYVNKVVAAPDPGHSSFSVVTSYPVTDFI